MKITNVGDGKVVLIAGGGKCYTDIAARFCRSEKPLDEIIASPYDKKIVDNIIKCGHLAATEFDYFIFGVEGFARVTEVQLVRKRIASYLIKSGRAEKNGKRNFDVVVPQSIMSHTCRYNISPENVFINDISIVDIFPDSETPLDVSIQITPMMILEMVEQWYNTGVDAGYKEEELRYLKPQATEFKAIIGMNIHALLDWWKIRLCCNAQTEIRNLATKMFLLSKKAAPDLCAEAGPSCVSLGYCPENSLQNAACKGKVMTKENALTVIKKALSDGKATSNYYPPNISPSDRLMNDIILQDIKDTVEKKTAQMEFVFPSDIKPEDIKEPEFKCLFDE